MGIDQETLEAIVHAVTAAMKVQNGGSTNSSKSIGGPPEWHSSQDEGGFVEWHVKMKAWLNNHDSQAQRAARDTESLIESDDIDVWNFNEESERVALKKFNGML